MVWWSWCILGAFLLLGGELLVGDAQLLLVSASMANDLGLAGRSASTVRPPAFWRTVRADYLLHRKTENYLGFIAMFNYRLGRYGAETKVTPWGWLLRKLHAVGVVFCEGFCGVHLGRKTKIGANLHLIHAGGINIHDSAVLGDRVGIMQNVTIGQNVGDGVPVIGDDVFIGAGASVLGKVTVGNNARIAANSLVICDVPPGHLAIGVPAKVVPNLFEEHKPKQQPAQE